MFDRTFVSTSTHGCITEGSKFMVIRAEYFPGLSCRPFQNDDHEGSHQEGSIGLLGIVETGVVIDFILDVLLITYKFFKLLAKKMDFS